MAAHWAELQTAALVEDVTAGRRDGGYELGNGQGLHGDPSAECTACAPPHCKKAKGDHAVVTYLCNRAISPPRWN